THERLSDAKKQAAMAQMVLNLAHKINNSVGAIRVWAMEAYHELSGENFDTFELKALLGNIMANVGETLLMVRRIRSATEIAADDIEPVNIVEVLENAVRASRVHAGIQIERQYESDLPPVAAETERLVEVFLNLVNNAGDALGASGRITMSLHRTGSGAVEVGIQDNGDGIPEHLQSTVFDPFVTSKTDGLGLGLWMVKLYVELINGSINLNTAPGKGTTFRVTLPAWQGGRLEAWKTGVR
ncbi:MAG TPA: ATP-binding protein, partial [Aggregatilineales bacterium]|nr:ATP-binding protein [Aggregatilineales bacterium]